VPKQHALAQKTSNCQTTNPHAATCDSLHIHATIQLQPIVRKPTNLSTPKMLCQEVSDNNTKRKKQIQLKQLVAVTTNTQIHETPEFKTQQIAQSPRRCSAQGPFHYY
jgi:hypothetical protein